MKTANMEQRALRDALFLKYLIKLKEEAESEKDRHSSHRKLIVDMSFPNHCHSFGEKPKFCIK